MFRFPIFFLLSIVAGSPLRFEGFPTPFNEWVKGNPWRESDSQIFVYIGSYKLSSIPKSADGSKTYDFHHSALVFHFQEEWMSLDLFMENPLDVGAMFVPLESKGWMNNATVRVDYLGKLVSRPTQYDALISVGETNGREFANLISRLSSDLEKRTSPLRYDVFSIVNENNQIIRTARSCFEFVESVLESLPITLSDKVTYYRDTVFIRVSNVVVHEAPHPESTLAQFNDFVANLVPELSLIARHLVYLRVVFAKTFYAEKNWWFAGLDHDEMWEVTLSEEYTDNGCKELVTLVPKNREKMGLVDVVRAGWERNATNCALPYQQMTDLKKFVIGANKFWTIGVYVSLGVIIVSVLAMKIRRKLLP